MLIVNVLSVNMLSVIDVECIFCLIIMLSVIMLNDVKWHCGEFHYAISDALLMWQPEHNSQIPYLDENVHLFGRGGGEFNNLFVSFPLLQSLLLDKSHITTQFKKNIPNRKQKSSYFHFKNLQL